MGPGPTDVSFRRSADMRKTKTHKMINYKKPTQCLEKLQQNVFKTDIQTHI
jgi:hypothetical protein